MFPHRVAALTQRIIGFDGVVHLAHSDLVYHPLCQGECQLSCWVPTPLQCHGAEAFGVWHKLWEERGAQPHLCSIAPLLPQSRAKEDGKRTEPRGPTNLFLFWSSCKPNHGLHFFLNYSRSVVGLGEETEQTELTDVLQWNCGLILMYFEKGKKN